MRTLSTAAALGSLLLVSGCSVFTWPNEKPVIEDNLRSSLLGDSEVGVLSLSPERRVVLNHFGNKRFCAEAPTEVGLDMARVAQLTGNAKLSEAQQAELSLLIASASKNQVLNARSQGMQLYLTGSYTLCQAFMNKAIVSEDEYLQAQLALAAAALDLMHAELPHFYRHLSAAASAPGSAAPAPAAGASSPSAALIELMRELRKHPKPSPPASAASSPTQSRLDQAPRTAKHPSPPAPRLSTQETAARSVNSPKLPRASLPATAQLAPSARD